MDGPKRSERSYFHGTIRIRGTYVSVLEIVCGIRLARFDSSLNRTRGDRRLLGLSFRAKTLSLVPLHSAENVRDAASLFPSFSFSSRKFSRDLEHRSEASRARQASLLRPLEFLLFSLSRFYFMHASTHRTQSRTFRNSLSTSIYLRLKFIETIYT